MKIHATFANRKCDPEVIELIDAWDEYGLDENPGGFADSRAAAVASLGDDLLRWVTVEIDVEAADIYDALDPSVCVRGGVTEIGGVGT